MRSITWGSAVRTVRQTPSRLTSIVASNASGSMVRIGPQGAMPALAMTTSIPPSCSTVPATAARRASQSVTSHSKVAVSVGSSAASAWMRSGSRPARASFMPLAASWRAVSAPIPRAGPVIRATRPESW